MNEHLLAFLLALPVAIPLAWWLHFRSVDTLWGLAYRLRQWWRRWRRP